MYLRVSSIMPNPLAEKKKINGVLLEHICGFDLRLANESFYPGDMPGK